MTGQLSETCCAKLPAAALRHLGELRACADLSGFIEGDSLWLYWSSGNNELSRAVLAVTGAELFLRRGRDWFRPSEHLPVFHVPKAQDAKPLSALLFPAPVMPLPHGQVAYQPATLSLVRCRVPRKATALLTTLNELLRWAEYATSLQLDSVAAACSGDAVLLCIQGSLLPGERTELPALAGERFWGLQVLLPLGWRVDPELAEDVLADALGLRQGDAGLWTGAGVEVITADAFGSVTRAGIRMLGEGARP